MFERLRRASQDGFIRSVGQLVGGTAIAQLIMVVALPVLTRLYSPSEFSILAVYAALLAILTSVASLRLELAIPIPEEEEVAASLLVLALCFSIAFSAAISAPILLFPHKIARALNVPDFAPHLWMVPLGVWVTSSYLAVQYWSTRKKKFPRIARTRVAQAVSGMGTQAGAGLFSLGAFGLLLGHMLSGAAGIASLARDAWKNDKSSFQSVSPRKMVRALRDYSKFPKYSAPEALASTAGSQLPVILVASIAIGPEAGFLMLATRAMGAPLRLIGLSVAQVYLSRAPEELRQGTLRDFTALTFRSLLRAGVGPILFAGIVAQPVFALVFGEEWRRTGEIVAWMTPWCILQFVASPVSTVMQVRMRQGSMLALTTTGLAVRVGAILVAAAIAPEYVVESYALAAGIYYLILACVSYRVAGCNILWLIRTSLAALFIPAVWVVVAFCGLGIYYLV